MAGRSKLGRLERISRLVDLLGLHPQSVAVGKAAGEFGIKADQIHRGYMAEARAAIAEAVGQTRTQMVRTHHHRLTALYHTAETVHDKLAALAQLASLHGLDAPSQVAVTVDVLYNPEEQLRALSDPRMLEKVLALDADFEQMRLGYADGKRDSGEPPVGEGADTGPAGVPGDPGLHVPPTSSVAPKGANGASPAA